MNDIYSDTLFPCANARLITRASAEKPGLADYTTKREWRRDLDQDIRREGFDYWWPNSSGSFATDPGGQPFPNTPTTSEPITLITQVKRPNGQTATVVGTKTKLWRFSSLDNGEYVSGDYIETTGPNTPYINDNPGEWTLIGSGFSTEGHRWESLNINGYLVLNNGVDLPMTFRVEDSEVTPIYELRENGVASVGTIGELAGILLVADISEIHPAQLEKIMEPEGDISSGDLTASQLLAGMTTLYDFFTPEMKDRWVIWQGGGAVSQIVSYTNPKAVVLDTIQTIDDKTFTLRNKAVQTGSLWSGSIIGTMTGGGFVVTASASIFTAPMVGSSVRFSNGFSGTITGFTSGTQVTLDTAPTDAIDGLPFWISGTASYTVTADANAFEADMVGKQIIWDTGDTRTIMSVTDEKNAVVETDSAQPKGFFRIENRKAYAAYTETENIDRVQYRLAWAMPDEPRRWGAAVGGRMVVGTNKLILDWPSKSFAVGQEIIVSGAGVDSGNLTATILSISAAGSVLILDQFASSTARGELVQQSDSVDSIVGFQDLQDDSSPILRVLKLGKVVVVYTSTAIFMGQYLGEVDAPFDFSERLAIPKSARLYYRWTLITVGGQYHLFASENSFHRFDMTVRVPEVVQELDLVTDIFLAHATLANTDLIFACDNARTDEIWIQFPNDINAPDLGICFDYKTGSVSTTGIQVTAGATIEKPVSGPTVGVIENWFVMGNGQGTILLYGKTTEVNPVWNAKEIFYQRSQAPFDTEKFPYESLLVSGIGAIGSEYEEKDIKSYVVHLASQSLRFPFAISLRGYVNPGDDPVALLTNFLIASPQQKNLVPVFYRQIYFQDQILVSGMDNPIRLAARSYDASLVKSQSHPRRP